ncbi:potassium-transporting ATPase subunit C [Williamsia sp.]|uniref:potassium-transporting ATPase subunit C n=1 Tax=Williamsia sp. TaxID=1872085 RepID=UPI002F95AAE5
MNTVTAWLRQCVVGLSILLAMTVILGVAYPAVVWGISRIGSTSAEGSAVTDSNGCVVGSSLIGIDPQVPAGEADKYLHARVLGSSEDPMAPGDPSASAAGNQGPNSEKLAGWIETRRQLIASREGVTPEQVPVDAVTGSGSSLDPHISEAYAQLQVPRIARENGITEARVREVIDANTDGRRLGFLGQPTVNVLLVNLGLGLTAPSCG